MKIGILFDLDGTLLDTLQDLKNSVNYALNCYGCPERTLEEIRSFVGNGARLLIARSLPGLETDPDVDTVLATFQQHYRAHTQVYTCPYPGILEALKTVQSRWPIAIVSNKPDGAVRTLCADCFGSVYARGETADCPRKPAPDMLYQAMQAIGVDNCIYVGDSEVDVTTAKNAGVKCLSVTWGFRDRAVLTEAGATHFCDDPHDLPATLEAMLQ